MGPILSSLVSLQSVEMKVRNTKKKLKKSRQTVLRQQHHIEQLKGALKAKREEIKLSRMQSDKLELELRSREDKIAKLRVVLNSAKTNKEYSIVLTSINTTKADNSKLEDQILNYITQIDSDQSACVEIEGNIEIEKQRLDDVLQETQKDQQNIEAELTQLNQQRAEAFGKVPPKHASMFDRLANRYDGEVLAMINEVNIRRSEYNCGGCFMKIPLEVVNSLMSHDNVNICPNCGRILILDMNPKQQSTA